ncbi:CAP domain-containing protein [Deinococcus cavernae]|uniref:CAP domain-containing protein n=1 Tax=Deinococcus cavernae TaxID=2320857 RepID=A0A418V1E4_9DEIO|nr:CAP domain-containing protein [Deinococcus cavernae]RJF69676.1 CAP domain-containing protein [Deinococcus cavernae]
MPSTTTPPTSTRPASTPPRPVLPRAVPPAQKSGASRPPRPLAPAPLRSAPLTALNAVRALAGLPGVKAEPGWQAECDAHANYLTRTDTGSHREDPADPHYTPAGANCAHAHYYVTLRPEATATQALTYWQNGPFHLPQLLDPRLSRAAFSVKHDTAGEIHTAAVLDVKRGRTGAAKYPVRFPRPGSVLAPQALSRFEFPDALPGCPGYAHPVGAPIALLLGQGRAARRAELKINGKAAAVCLLTAQTFSGASAGDTRVGRSVLEAQGVAIALPASRCRAPRRYTSFSRRTPARWAGRSGRAKGNVHRACGSAR